MCFMCLGHVMSIGDVGSVLFVFGLGDGSHFVLCCGQRVESGICCVCTAVVVNSAVFYRVRW